MKKICFALVLNFVSLFSIAAQTAEIKPEKQISTENPKTEISAPANVVETKPAANVAVPAQAKKPEVKMEEKPAIEVKPEEKKPAIEVKPEADTAEKQAKTEPKTETKNEAIKPETVETIEKTETPLLQTKKSSLGNLSTGNAAVDGYIEEFCELYDVDSRLIYAQMNQESGFSRGAVSPKGASGLMQLMPDTARRFGVTNVYNPKQNIKAGVKYMRWLLDKFGGDVRLALAGYNAGEGSVVKFGNQIPPYRETQNYVARIMTHYEMLSNQDAATARKEEQ